MFARLFDPRRFLMVEPSAGTGSFSLLLPPGSRAIDIDPKVAGVEAHDFLKFKIGGDRPIAIIGNPPFSNGMARKFFNHAALEAEVIAFIVPRSFRKAAVQNKLDRNFHLLHEEDVERDAFIFRSKQVHVPAVFQIWIRRGVKRKLRDEPTTHEDFDFLPNGEGADFAIQRIGARAGWVHDEFKRSAQAHYFISSRRPGVRAIMERLDFDSLSRDVAGKPSLAMTDIVWLYANRIFRPGATSARASFG